MKKNIYLLFAFSSLILLNNSNYGITSQEREMLAKSIKEAEYQIKENRARREIIQTVAHHFIETEKDKAHEKFYNAIKNLLTLKGSFQEVVNAYNKKTDIEQISPEVTVVKAESFLNATGYLEAAAFFAKHHKPKPSDVHETHPASSFIEILGLF